MNEKPKCIIPGCSNKRVSKGKSRSGKTKYGKLCSSHKREKEGGIHNLDTSKCTLCGWEGPCDKHRIIMGKDGGRYTKGNVIVICPNCHRLLHTGKLFLK